MRCRAVKRCYRERGVEHYCLKRRTSDGAPRAVIDTGASVDARREGRPFSRPAISTEGPHEPSDQIAAGLLALDVSW